MCVLLYTDDTIMNPNGLIAITRTVEVELIDDMILTQVQDNENFARMFPCDRIFLSTLCIFLFIYALTQLFSS